MTLKSQKPRKAQSAAADSSSGDELNKTSDGPVAVIGDGWAALGAVGFLVETGRKVRWVTGAGSRFLAPLPTLEVGESTRGPAIWARLAEMTGVTAGELQTGSYLREFRNKAFREPAWTKAPTPEQRQQVLEEVLWGPERQVATSFEGRFACPLSEIEMQIRTRLGTGQNPLITRTEGTPVTDILLDGDRVRGVLLGSGEEIACEQVIYADRWSLLPMLPSLPKSLQFTRKRVPTGVIQALFNHQVPMGVGLQEGFFGTLHKEAGEQNERHVWGHFWSDGSRSVWTICLSPEEVEDNHLIAKKLRRMKNALEKMFAGSAWLPEGKPEFNLNIASEQVRFEESVICSEGEAPREPIRLFANGALKFLTDGYGPSSAMHQLGMILGDFGIELPAVQADAPVLPEAASPA